MLVLSRKKNESIVINNDITIVVVEIRGDKVRLGVEAPKEVPVHRREVYDAIRRSDVTVSDSDMTVGKKADDGRQWRGRRSLESIFVASARLNSPRSSPLGHPSSDRSIVFLFGGFDASGVSGRVEPT